MKAVIRILAAGVCSVVLATTTSTALGQFVENFDTYAPGSQLHGQGIWAGWDNTPSAGAVLSSAFTVTPPNAVNITGGSDLVGQFSGFSGGMWSLSLRQYVPGNSTGNSYLILMNKYTPNGAAADYNWSVQIENNMGTGEVISDMVATGGILPIVRDSWNTWRFDIDLTSGNGMVSEYYNGTLLATHPWHDGTGVNAIGAIDLFANGAGPVYYDDLTITMIPEPGSLGLLALGGLLFVLRRKAH